MFLSKINNFGLFNDLFYTVYDNSYIVKSDKSISIKVELPGFTKENVRLSCNGKNLELEAVRGEPNAKVYSNSWVLDSNIDTTNITAKLDCGILSITLPYISEEKTMEIPIT